MAEEQQQLKLHWVTRYDEEDGEPYGELCRCSIDADHDAAGNLL